MKIYFLLFVGLMLCLSISETKKGQPRPLSLELNEAIEKTMEERFAARDDFIEKSNRGHFVRTHETFPRIVP